MKNRKRQRPVPFLAVLMFVIAASFGYANAMSFDIGEATLDVDVQLIYGAAIRAEAPSPASLGATSINSDDGNRNFDKWDLIGNKISSIVDAELNYINFGIFVRAKAFYDLVYMGDHANNDTGTNNYYLAGQNGIVTEKIGVDEWPDDVKETHGAKAELLDYFITYNFEIGNVFGDIRMGNQVVQWGESMFISSNSIASAMAHADGVAATAPGAQVKEILMPSRSAQLNLALTNTISVGGFYQWEWKHTVYPEVGTYWNNLYDIVDETPAPMLAAPPGTVVPLGALGLPDYTYTNGLWYTRAKDQGIDSENQFGVKFNWIAPEVLNSTEFGLYYINYNLKTATTIDLVTTNYHVAPIPALGFPGVPAGPIGGYFNVVYFDDIRLYGASFSSQIGETNVSGEFTYHHGYPIGTSVTDPATLLPIFERDGIMQAQVSFIHLFPTNFLWFFDGGTLMGEVGVQWVVGFDKDELADDKWGWGGTIMASPNLRNILPGVELSIPVSYSFRPHGSTGPYGSTATFTEGDDSIGVGLSFKIFTDYNLAIAYSEYFSKTDTGNVDRDNISCTLTYTF